VVQAVTCRVLTVEILVHCQDNRGIFGERSGTVVRFSPVTYVFSRNLFHHYSVIICNHGLEQMAHLGFQTMDPLSPHFYKNDLYFNIEERYA
jgi:hypothetical protein